MAEHALQSETGRTALAVVAWLWVLVPFTYGIWELLIKVVQLFG
jgi:hypothetical protein